MSADAMANPYVGPRSIAYGEPIHGRDREIQGLRDTLVPQRIVLLYSPSGAGKSSLLEAGLRPQLEDRGFLVLPTVRIGHDLDVEVGNRYLMSTKLSLADALPADQQWDQGKLAQTSLGDHIDRIVSLMALNDEEPCLIFDQFEELFTLDPVDWDAKQEFLTELGIALRVRTRWRLCSMREDYIALLDPYLDLIPTRLSNRIRLDLLGPAEARLAATRPADAAGVPFSDEAADRLIDDLRRTKVSRGGVVSVEHGRHVEPVVLQVVCRRLWDLVTSAKTASMKRSIGVDDIDALGHVDNALADFCDGRIAGAAGSSGVSEQRIRDWIERDLITAQGFRGQTMYGPTDAGDEVLRALEDGHLLRAESRRGAIWYEIPHDRLVAPIRRSNERWRDEHLKLFQSAARHWDDNDRSVDMLLGGQVIENGEQWLADHPDEVLSVDHAFIEASRVQQYRLDSERRRQRQNRRLGALAAALVIVLLAGIAWRQDKAEADADAAVAVAEAASVELMLVLAGQAQADVADADGCGCGCRGGGPGGPGDGRRSSSLGHREASGGGCGGGGCGCGCGGGGSSGGGAGS